MRIFVTGASGFVGSAVIADLIAAGHTALGLARSDAAAEAVAKTGATVHRGSLEDLDSLRAGAKAGDGVIHCGFIHDFSKFMENLEIDRRAILAMGETLADTDKPMLVTSGMVPGTLGRPILESDRAPPVGDPKRHPRAISEDAADAAAALGARVSAVRLPQVHGDGDHAFVPQLINVAREKGFSAYIGEGQGRWPAVHRFDAARVYRLAVEKGASNERYHAVADEGVPLRTIAEAIGKGLNVPVRSITPEQAQDHFGWFAMFAAMDLPTSSAWTQQRLGWTPTHVGLLEDLAHGTYFSGT